MNQDQFFFFLILIDDLTDVITPQETNMFAADINLFDKQDKH